MTSATAAAADGPTSEKRPVHIVLLFIPGNPGLSNYYDPFFASIESQLSARASACAFAASASATAGAAGSSTKGGVRRELEGITIMTTNQLGFTSVRPSAYAIRPPSYLRPSSAWPWSALGYSATEAVGLEAQLLHKLDLCADVLAPAVRALEHRLQGKAQVKVVVAGHSVGAYMCLPLLARYGVPSAASTDTATSPLHRNAEAGAPASGRKSRPSSGVTSPASSSSTLVGVASPSAEKPDGLDAAGASSKGQRLVIDRAYLLTPTVMHIARSPNGLAAVRLRWLPWVSVTIVCIACSLLWLAEQTFRLYGAAARLIVSDAAPLDSSATSSSTGNGGGAHGGYRSPLHNLVKRMTTMTTDASIAVTVEDLVTSPRNAFAGLWLGRSEMVGIGEDLDISPYFAPAAAIAAPATGGGDGKGGQASNGEKYAFWNKFGGKCRALWSIGTHGLSARSDGDDRTRTSTGADASAGSRAAREMVGAAKEAIAAVIDEDSWVDPSTRLRLCRTIAPPAMLEQSVESRTVRHAWCTDRGETDAVAAHVVDWLVEDFLS